MLSGYWSLKHIHVHVHSRNFPLTDLKPIADSMANITKILLRREIHGREPQECEWIADQLLDNLFWHESYFDHDSLFVLHINIKNLCASSPSIRNTVIHRLQEWEERLMAGDCEETVIRSHVFLVKYIVEYLSETELKRLEELVDDIKQNTN